MERWDAISQLALAPPVVPPTPVYIPTPPRAPSIPAEWKVDPATGEIDDAMALTAPEDGAAASQERLFPEGEAPVELSAPDVRGGEDQALEWSGPAVLMLGSAMVVGFAVEPDRKVVVELACYLACHRDGPRSTEQVQAALWPLHGSKGDVSIDTVRQHLSRLRRCVGEENLPDAAKAGGYWFGENVASDWGRFQALSEAARRCEGDRSAKFRRDALALVRGAPFAGVAAGTFGWAWEELIVATMEAAISDVAHRLAVESLDASDPRTADWAASRGLLAVPTDETLLADRMAAGFAMGGHPALDRAWRDAKAVLGEQAESGPLAGEYARLNTRGQ